MGPEARAATEWVGERDDWVARNLSSNEITLSEIGVHTLGVRTRQSRPDVRISISMMLYIV